VAVTACVLWMRGYDNFWAVFMVEQLHAVIRWVCDRTEKIDLMSSC